MKRSSSKEHEKSDHDKKPGSRPRSMSRSPEAPSSRKTSPHPGASPYESTKMSRDLEDAARESSHPKRPKSRSRSPKSHTRLLIAEEPEPPNLDNLRHDHDAAGTTSSEAEEPRLKIKDHEWKIGLKLEPIESKKSKPARSRSGHGHAAAPGEDTHSFEYWPKLKAPEVTGVDQEGKPFNQQHFYLDPPYKSAIDMTAPEVDVETTSHGASRPSRPRSRRGLQETEEEMQRERHKREQSPHDYHTSDDSVKKHFLLGLMPHGTPKPSTPPLTVTSPQPMSPRSRSPGVAETISPRRKPKEDLTAGPGQFFKTYGKPSAFTREVSPTPAPNIVQHVSKPFATPVIQEPQPVKVSEKEISPTLKPKARAPSPTAQPPSDEPAVPPKHEMVTILPPQKIPEKPDEAVAKKAQTPKAEGPGEKKIFSPQFPPLPHAAGIEPSMSTIADSQATLAGAPPRPVLFGAKIKGPGFAALEVKPQIHPAPPETERKFEHPKVPDVKAQIEEGLRKLQAPPEESVPQSEVSLIVPLSTQRPDVPSKEKLPEPPKPHFEPITLVKPIPFLEKPAEEKAETTPVKEKVEKLPIPRVSIIITPPPEEKHEEPQPPVAAPVEEKVPEKLPEAKPEKEAPKPEIPKKEVLWKTLFKAIPKLKPKPEPEPIPKSPEQDLAVIKKPAPRLTKSPTDIDDMTKAAQLAMKTKKTFDAINQMRKEREKLGQMGDYGIPDQKHLLDILLPDDLKVFDFGGFLRQYFSPSLRTFTLFNLQGRYRGAENADCLKAINVERLASKEDAEAAARARNLNKRNEVLEELRAVAVDEEHFQFLKGFANMQQITFPVTVSHGMLQETVPMLDEIFHFYLDHLEQDHKCTIEAGEHFVRHRNRLNMYDNL